MPPVSIGRIGYRLLVPPSSQELFVFLDAGGRAGDSRIWGGLAVFGEDELNWIKDAVKEVRGLTGVAVEPDGELKGRGVPLNTAQGIGRRIRDEDHRIVFWGSRHGPPTDESVSSWLVELGEFLNGLCSEPTRLDQRQVNSWFGGKSQYYGRLKAVNKHKVVAIVAHLQWLISQLKSTGTASRLRRAALVIDRENFPSPVSACGELVKAFFSAGLQASGMSYRLTGRALRESASEGAVTVDVNGDSSTDAGLQLVDVLLQVVQRQLSA